MDMQNVSNLTIPEGQVRTIHDKDSRLIWGRVAYNTKYAGDTLQQTYSGKNLFNYQGVVNLAIAPPIAAKSTYRGYYIQANAGDTFTLSRAITTGNNRFRVCFTMVEPAQGVDIYNENGVVGGYISADGATEVSFTVPQDMHYVFIYLSNSDQDITESLKIQLETGSTATAYEPYVGGIPSPNPDYPQAVQTVTGEQTVTISDGVDSEAFPISLGSLELCKIGDYQDYIYKDGDDWYVHKETGKLVLNGTGNYATLSDGDHGEKRFRFTNSTIGNIDVNIRSTYCDVYQGVQYSNSKATPNSIAQWSQQNRFTITTNRTTYSLNDFEADLASSPATVYYALATPTNTKITDAILVAQLNAVHQWATRYGYNVTVSGDLPIVLQRSSLQ